MIKLIRDTLRQEYLQQSIASPVPFLFANNDSAFKQWSGKADVFFNQQQLHAESLKKGLRQAAILPSTKLRIEAQLEAEKKLTTEIDLLLKPYSFIQQPTSTAGLLLERIPSNQHIRSYLKNIFRDWAWGENENHFYRNYLAKHLPELGNTLIVGGGAGRTLYDICQLRPKHNVLSLDINPLLSIVGQKIVSGDKVELTEIPNFNLTNEKLSQEHKLQAPQSLPMEQFAFALGDISSHPFKDAVFQTVVCPWVIDILPEPADSLVRRLNFLLENDGRLIVYGPLSFERQKPENQHCFHELQDLLKASGFEVETSALEWVPYLQSPLDCQKRQEEIFMLTARKKKATKKPAPYFYYPEWIRNPEAPMTSGQEQLHGLFTSKSMEGQLIGSIIQGQSVRQISQQIAQHSGVKAEEAESLLLSILSRLFETGEISAD